MGFLYFVCIIIVLVIDFIIAKNFSEIAEMKGYEESKYFWFTFLFGLVGMLMVIALPNIKEVTIKNMPVKPSVPLLTSEPKKEVVPSLSYAHKWRCESCDNMRTQSPCEHCGKE